MSRALNISVESNLRLAPCHWGAFGLLVFGHGGVFPPRPPPTGGSAVKIFQTHNGDWQEKWHCSHLPRFYALHLHCFIQPTSVYVRSVLSHGTKEEWQLLRNQTQSLLRVSYRRDQLEIGRVWKLNLYRESVLSVVLTAVLAMV